MKKYLKAHFLIKSIVLGCIILLAVNIGLMAQNVSGAPSWRVQARCFFDGASGAFDNIAVKDPSIVYSGGLYHLFYTGTEGSNWRMGYASASTINGLSSATHNYISTFNVGSYFCAPQVFWFASKGTWYLIFQSGLGATFSTNTNISNPSGWSAGGAMGFTDGIDFWCISDGSNVYCFYSAQDGSYTIKRRSTTVANFPYGWSSATTVATSTFEAPNVYKNLGDGWYYMIVEDISRHQELWRASSLGGTWTKVSEEWAHANDLIYDADHWTDQVSHCEIIRSGTNELLEVNDLNNCVMLFQGVPTGDYGTYINIPYDLGTATNAYSIVVRARGTSGSENINLKVGSTTTLANWTLSTSYQNYSAPTSMSSGEVYVQFDNDNGTTRDVQVDYVQVNGSTRQAESQAYNTGVWQDGGCGGSYSEWIHCNGTIGFGDITLSKSAQEEIIPEEKPTSFTLEQNYPNPFNPSTLISFGVPQSSFVSLKVYDMLGQEIIELAGREYSAGSHTVTFDASKLASGTYLYTLRAGDFSTTRKMLFVK